MTDVDPHALLELAVATAREAGQLALAGRDAGELETATKSSPTDVVTAMDRLAESTVVQRLLGARPDDGLLGEEGADRAGTSGVRWVIDPIDGTVNYLFRLGHWAVCIAAEVDGEVVAGVVYDPTLDQTWTAVRGEGAWRDGQPLRCSTTTELGQALVATGFGYEARRRTRQARTLMGVLPAVRDIRRFGSGALDLCASAAGVVDAYYEQGLQPWDLAAAGLIAREAGCRVEGLRGMPAGEALVISAGPGLFEVLHDLLAMHGAGAIE